MLRTRPARAHERGFSLLELMVVVAVIGILAAIAVPNVLTAMEKSRHTAAYTNMKVLEGAVLTYMLEKDGPPTSLNAVTLEPLVRDRYMSREQRRAVLSAIDRNQLLWYWGWSGSGWWDYDYIIAFRPKKDDPNVWCYVFPEGIWRYPPNAPAYQVM